MEYEDTTTDYEYDYYYGNHTLSNRMSYTEWLVPNVLDGLATALGLLANALLLTLLIRAPSLRTVSSMFLLQRAVADMLLLVVTPFLMHERLYRRPPYSAALCVPLTIVLHGALVASYAFLTLFTVDSYLMSRHQRHKLPLRRKVMRLTSVGAWLLALVYGVAVYFYYNYSLYGHCFFHWVFMVLQVQDIVIHLVLPPVVVWVLVSVTFCCRRPDEASTDKAEEGHEGPNRPLLLSLAATLTVVRVFVYVGIFLDYGYIYTHQIFIDIFSTLPTVEKVINPVLVICLTKGLRQKVAGWLSSRSSNALPLQDL